MVGAYCFINTGSSSLTYENNLVPDFSFRFPGDGIGFYSFLSELPFLVVLFSL